MNGAEALLHTLVDGGIELMLSNPGTSEMYIVEALERFEGIRAVLALSETVCSGAADGYARMADKPASTLFHLGPGFANGLANFHNARRARTPVVNIIGDHATWHRPHDPPLNCDIDSLARPVSGWLRNVQRAGDIAADATAAIRAAREPPGQIATLVVPADCTWESSQADHAPITLPVRRKVPAATLEHCTRILRARAPAVLLVNGLALREPGLQLLERIAAASGARLMADTFPVRTARGRGRPPIERMPYFPEAALAALAGTRHLLLVGADAPIAFFGYPGQVSQFAPADCEVVTLADPGADVIDALEYLADALNAPRSAPGDRRATPAMPEPGPGALTPETVAQALAHLLPEGAVVAEEAITSGFRLQQITAGAAPHDWLSHTGGAIGHGIPLATGAALACPGRKVICLQADGSAMYSLQALWTQARERLDVTTVIYANRLYRILGVELERLGVERPGPRAAALIDIGNPTLDWVALARGMGVEASRAQTVEQFSRAFAHAMRTPGPHLIEAVV
jgi:acetolactate synthase-1/2/3 large subunit